jgi:hypothetical protein
MSETQNLKVTTNVQTRSQTRSDRHSSSTSQPLSGNLVFKEVRGSTPPASSEFLFPADHSVVVDKFTVANPKVKINDNLLTPIDHNEFFNDVFNETDLIDITTDTQNPTTPANLNPVVIVHDISTLLRPSHTYDVIPVSYRVTRIMYL